MQKIKDFKIDESIEELCEKVNIVIENHKNNHSVNSFIPLGSSDLNTCDTMALQNSLDLLCTLIGM